MNHWMSRTFIEIFSHLSQPRIEMDLKPEGQTNQVAYFVRMRTLITYSCNKERISIVDTEKYFSKIVASVNRE